MKKIKLSGRELAVLRAIDFSTGTEGSAVLERTQLERGDLVDILNSMMEVGYVETNPVSQCVKPDLLHETMLEINPAYVHDLRAAIVRV
jgi:DNA-binding MarR family transcriptional regulator